MNNRYVSNLAFIDLLFNLILGFVFLFLIAFMLINKPTETGKIDPKAEFIIVMYWQNEHIGDVDLWVDTPDGLVNYISPNMGSTHLDKDDLGIRNDWFTDANGDRQYIYINREVVSLRAFTPGEYIVNAHYYGSKAVAPFGTGQVEAGPAEVTIDVIRLNPFYILKTRQHTLDKPGAEKTFMRFTMSSDGLVSNINYLPKRMVTSYAGAELSATPTSDSQSALTQGP